MRVALAWLAALLSLLSAPAAAQTTRALFVGVDTYRFARSPALPNADFRNLAGAVGDVVRFKNMLRATYKVPLDGAKPGAACPAGLQANSITLYNECATRAAVLAALDELIAVSAPKDTLIFYFAGHGSRYPDDTEFGQASGFFGTIMPWDARDPAAIATGDIVDKQLKAIKERAVAKGIYWVSVFDSCNSGTATRDGALGVARSAPPLKLAPPPFAAAPAAGPGGGYWVHLAAAQDDEQAMEGDVAGQRQGAFTSALIAAMQAMPYATFGDLIREVQAQVAARGNLSQNPMAEGTLKAALGRAEGSGVPFEVEVAGGRAALLAGRFSGVTTGSIFALYPNAAAALTAGGAPLATARVGQVADDRAELIVAGALPTPSNTLSAVETVHAFGDLQVRVANRMSAPAEKQAVAKVLAAAKFVTPDSAAPQLAVVPAKTGEAALIAADGTPLGELGAVADTAFAERLAGKLRKVLRVQQLLALRTAPDKSGLALCIDDSAYEAPAAACPALERGNMRVIKQNANALVTVHNTVPAPRHVYVFGIDPTFGVALILPRPGTVDAKLDSTTPLRIPDDPVVMTRPGLYRFVTIATDKPINAAALEQSGTTARGVGACASALEKLLCDANRGSRDPAAPQVGDWTAAVDTVLVE